MAILDSSFNPPTKAHKQLLLSTLSTLDVSFDHVLLLFSTKNADKALEGATVEDRVDMMIASAQHVFDTHPEVPPITVALTHHAKFADKAKAIRQHVHGEPLLYFILGYDTLIRLFDGKYYLPLAVERALTPFFETSRVVCANREGFPDDDVQQFWTSAQVQPFKDKIYHIQLNAIDASISSTKAREAKGNMDALSAIVDDAVLDIVLSRQLPTIAPPSRSGTGEQGFPQSVPNPTYHPPPAYGSETNQRHSGIAIDNAMEGAVVNQRIFLVDGRVTSLPPQIPARIHVSQKGFPTVAWPVYAGIFKCLVHLEPGPNTITFTVVPAPQGPPVGDIKLEFHLVYVPLLQNPPLHLVILLASDSKMTFDAPPNRNYSNDLETAIQKFRMAAYMWQAFCSEQLYRNGFGHRTFRLHETWQPDTLSFQDVQNKISRETAHVHVIRAKKHSLKDILDPKIAQQSPDRDDSKKSLFSIFLEELNDYGPPFTNQNCYVAGLIMDTHWDTSRQVVLGHAALGGGAGNIRLGIFGSHSLHSWPRWVEDIEYCFMDSTATNTRYVANDAGESGEHWKCANVGMGAMLHEVGHCLTLAHTPTGLMSRGFNNYNRTFMPVEPHNSNPLPPSAEEGSHWHRLDIIRLRYHPCFRLPSDVLPPYASSPLASEFIPLDSGLRISAPAGLTMLEIWVDGRYNRHYEFINERQTYLPTSYDVDLVNIKLTVGWRQGQRLRLEGSTVNQQTFEMDDIIGFVESRIVKLPGVHGKCIKGADIGGRGLGAREASHVILSKPAQESNSLVSDLRRLHLGHSRDTEDAVPNAYVTHVRIHCGDALDGLVFFYSDGSTSFLGKTGGGTREFSIAKGDRIKHFVVRAGLWVDGIEIVTEQSRSGWCGGTGGALYVVEPPKGYSLVGCFATAGDWMDSFGIYYQSSV